MADESGGQSFLIGLILTTIVLGTLVLVFKPDYRFEQIAISNEDYYPNTPITSSSDD